jgi:hypothetical protein
MEERTAGQGNRGSVPGTALVSVSPVRKSQGRPVEVAAAGRTSDSGLNH